MQHFYSNISGWFEFPKLYSEMVANAKDGDHFVEVGTFKGQSAAFMAVEIVNSNKKIKFDCIDTWLGHADHQASGSDPQQDVIDGILFEVFQKNMLPVANYYTPIRLPSVEAAKTYKDNSLDFVFIDASHDFKSVLEDVHSWFPKVKKGGIIAGHDYRAPDVKKAVDLFFKNKKNIKLQEECWIHSKGE